MSKKMKIPWLSCDTLDAVTQEYVSKEEWPKKYPYSFLRRKGDVKGSNDAFYNTYSPERIMSVLKKQGSAVFKTIDTVIACEIADGNDYIIEGYHIVPSFAHKMIKKYGKDNVRAVFLTKFDEYKFAKDVHKSTTPNDWLIVLTKKEETFVKVGKMVSCYSKYFEKEAQKFGLPVCNMDNHFTVQINKAIKCLIV